MRGWPIAGGFKPVRGPAAAADSGGWQGSPPGAGQWSAPPPPAPQRAQVGAGVGKPPHGLGVCIWMYRVNGTGNSPSPGWPTPGVVKQDKSSGGSVDTTKTRSGPQRVRMSSGERPIDAAKGKYLNTEALCQPPPSPRPFQRRPAAASSGPEEAVQPRGHQHEGPEPVPQSDGHQQKPEPVRVRAEDRPAEVRPLLRRRRSRSACVRTRSCASWAPFGRRTSSEDRVHPVG